MNLISLKVHERGSSGWRSDYLEFGEYITQLFGPNGCGKTPLIQMLTYCLGYPSVFRHDIYERCKSVVVEVATARGQLRIKREISKDDVDIEVSGEGLASQRFYNELDYSVFIFDWVGISPGKLVSVSNKPASAYLSTLMPIFYLNQDGGYSSLYNAPAKFIKDQFSEMVRLLFQLPVKNSFDVKKDRFLAKEKVEYFDKEVHLSRRMLDLAKAELDGSSPSVEELNSQISLLESEIELLKSSGSGRDDSVGAIDRLISQQRSNIRSTYSDIDALSKRVNGVARIVHEINTEIDTLTLNEEARRVFLSFNEICGSAGCGLFTSSSESYAKNLLYLRDQIKDLERNSEADSIRLAESNARLKVLEEQLQELVVERNKVVDRSEISSVVEAISVLKTKVFELQSKKNELEKVGALERRHFNIVAEREKALDSYQSLDRESIQTASLIRVRSEIRDLFIEWLDVIHIVNISKVITFKDDFSPVLGVETISQLTGSTKVRAILAYHAALVEALLRRGSLPFKFLILDTPKQHEIPNVDLDRYFGRLKRLGEEFGLQVVFSSTEYHYELADGDREWIPIYPGEEQDMFLSKPDLTL